MAPASITQFLLIRYVHWSTTYLCWKSNWSIGWSQSKRRLESAHEKRTWIVHVSWVMCYLVLHPFLGRFQYAAHCWPTLPESAWVEAGGIRYQNLSKKVMERCWRGNQEPRLAQAVQFLLENCTGLRISDLLSWQHMLWSPVSPAWKEVKSSHLSSRISSCAIDYYTWSTRMSWQMRPIIFPMIAIFTLMRGSSCNTAYGLKWHSTTARNTQNWTAAWNNPSFA